VFSGALRDRLKNILQEDEVFVCDMTTRKRNRVTDVGFCDFVNFFSCCL